MSPFSAICLMLFGKCSKLLKISSAFSEAKTSVYLLYLIVTSIKIAPVTDPIFSQNDCDLESSSKNINDACLMDW